MRQRLDRNKIEQLKHCQTRCVCLMEGDNNTIPDEHLLGGQQVKTAISKNERPLAIQS
jgi:hypothetical protein